MPESLDEHLKKEGEQLRRKQSGGYVYPHKAGSVIEPGITYRQWLVGIIIPSLISGQINLKFIKGTGEIDLAAKACELADELIAEEKK